MTGVGSILSDSHIIQIPNLATLKPYLIPLQDLVKVTLGLLLDKRMKKKTM